MGVIRRRSIDEIFVKVEKKLKQEKSKVRLLDSIIKKTLKEIKDAEKTYIDNKSNIRRRSKN